MLRCSRRLHRTDTISSKSFNANLELIEASNRIILMYKNGEIGPYTGARVSELTAMQAR